MLYKVEIETPKFPEPIIVTSPLREKGGEGSERGGEKATSPRDGHKKEKENEKEKEKEKQDDKGKEEESSSSSSESEKAGGDAILGDLD